MTSISARSHHVRTESRDTKDLPRAFASRITSYPSRDGENEGKVPANFFWPSLGEDIERTVRECTTCQAWAPAQPETTVCPTAWPHEPWSILNMDVCGPVEGKMLLIVVDQTSKWFEVEILKRTNSAAIITVLRSIFARFGMPLTMIADNATYFQSSEIHTFFRLNGIRLAASAPYHPRTNGQAERAVRTVKMAITKMKDNQTSLADTISRFLLEYWSTPQSTTNQ